MTLPSEVQPLVNQLRAALGIPPQSQMVINVDEAGTVTTAEAKIVYRRTKTAVDKPERKVRN